MVGGGEFQPGLKWHTKQQKQKKEKWCYCLIYDIPECKKNIKCLILSCVWWQFVEY